MARFSQIVQGTAATREATVEFLGGKKDKLLIRVLSGEEEADVAAWARQYVVERKAEGSEDLYELASFARRVTLACMDVEAPSVQYFESTEEVLASHIIGRDRIAYLAELQLHWQTECSPSLLNLSPTDFEAKIREIAGSDKPDPFVSLRPGLQWILMRSTARQLLALRSLKLQSGGLSEPTSTSAEQAP